MAKRYDQMLPLVAKVKPRRIVEVGVHRGMRASRLCMHALAIGGPVHYIGFDVFDTMDEAFQEAALNGKGMPTEAKARERLDEIAVNFPEFTYEFVIGDTRETLHGRTVDCDFAFIDGDHRVDAIRGDYLALAGAKCVVFDDYYRPNVYGSIPDLRKYGANQTVDGIKGRRVQILPECDECKHSGISHLAVVWK